MNIADVEKLSLKGVTPVFVLVTDLGFLTLIGSAATVTHVASVYNPIDVYSLPIQNVLLGRSLPDRTLRFASVCTNERGQVNN